MTLKSDDEYFSADSLDVHEGASKEKKSKKSNAVERRKKRKTYSELNQIYVLREFMKATANKIKSNSDGCETKESIKYPTRNSSQENVEVLKIHPMNHQAKSKIPRILWSEFISNQYKLNRCAAIENSEAHKLQKRIEYGRRMSSMNRINQQCQKLHRKISATENSHQNNTTDSRKVSKSTSSIVEATKTHSKALKSSSSSSKDVNVNKDIELELKLECMQIRHQNDRKKVDRMKSAMMNQKIMSNDENGGC